MSAAQVYDNLKHHGEILDIFEYVEGFTIVLSTVKPIHHVFDSDTLSIDGIDHVFTILELSTYYENVPKLVPIADSLLPAPDQQSPQHMLNTLCDDVLHIIFKEFRYDLTQLVQIANVCTRFHPIASDIYMQSGNDGKLICQPTHPNQRLASWYEYEYLPTFGHLITEFDARIMHVHTALQLVAKYCVNVEQFKCLMYKVIHADQSCILPIVHVPKLVDLHLAHMHFNHMPSTKGFFQANPQVEQLTLNNVTMAFSIDHILRCMPNLKVLSLRGTRFDCDDWECFGELTNLKSLRLQGYILENIPHMLQDLVDGNVQLERLKLFGLDVVDDELIQSICQIKSLTWLTMDLIGDIELEYFVDNLKHLNGIYSKSCNASIRGIRHTLEQFEQLTTVKLLTRPSDATIDAEDINAIDEMRKKRLMDLRIDTTVDLNTFVVIIK